MLSFDEVAHTYNVCFVINENFKVNDIRGKLAFREEYFSDGCLLPEYAVESDNRSPFRVLMANSKEFFRLSQYAAIILKQC